MKEPTTNSKHETSVSILRVLAGGTALGLSFLPLPLWWLAWIALAPLLLIWASQRSMLRFVAEIYTAFLIAYALGLFWPMLHVFSQSAVLAFGGLLFIPLLWTAPLVGSRFFLQRYGKVAGFSALIVLFLSVEMLFLHGPIAFPWPVLGTTQADAVALIQFIEYSGVLGLSLWVLVLNVGFFALLSARRVKGKVWSGLVLVVLLGSSFAFSTWRTDQMTDEDNFITVGLIQPALSNSDWSDRRGANRLVRLTALSDSLVTAMNAPPVFMIWPERAVPAPFSKLRRRFVDTQLQSWSERLQVALLSGALVPDGEPGVTDRFYNSAILYRPRTTPQRYDQERFTPFQHRVPLTDYVPVPAAGMRPVFRKGATPDQLSFDDIKVGMLLDFELLLGHFARRLPSEGADFLVSLSQQEEWGRAPVTLDHLRFARLRAMESRRSVVRVTASGHSAVVSPIGETLLQSSSEEASARLAAVPLKKGATVYAKHGDVIGWAALIPASVLLLLLLIRALWKGVKYTGNALTLWEKQHSEAV